MAGAVGVAGVAESASVLSAVVVGAFRVEGEVVGVSAGGLAGVEGFDVVDSQRAAGWLQPGARQVPSRAMRNCLRVSGGWYRVRP